MGRDNKKVIFLLAGWCNKLWMYWIFSKIIAMNGFYCITYAYDVDVLSPDTKKTLKHFSDLRDSILKKISKLKKEGYKEFSIFGTSLGSVISLMVANNSPEISKVILNAVGADLAETVWSWDKIIPSFKDRLLKQGLTLSKLKKEWRKIAPINNIHNLKNKNILVYLSKKDEVIPFGLGKKLVREFDKKNYNYTLVVNNKLRHLNTCAYNLFKVNVYLNFLKG